MPGAPGLPLRLTLSGFGQVRAHPRLKRSNLDAAVRSCCRAPAAMPRWMGREGVMLMKASLLGVLAVAAVVSGCVAPAQPPGPPVMAIYAPPPADYRAPPVGPVGR